MRNKLKLLFLCLLLSRHPGDLFMQLLDLLAQLRFLPGTRGLTQGEEFALAVDDLSHIGIIGPVEKLSGENNHISGIALAC